MADHVDKLFDMAGKVIIEMNAEIENLAIKFGQESRLVITKKEQLNILTQFYDGMIDTIDNYEQLNKLLSINNKILKEKICQRELNIKSKQVANLNGTTVPKHTEIFDQLNDELDDIAKSI